MGSVNNNQLTVREQMINDFKDIAIGESSESAAQFLRAADWNFEEAVSLFYTRDQDPEEEEHDDDNSGLDYLYPAPASLINKGSFEKSKSDAKAADKWLIVNIQSNTDFSSHMLNGHTWANKTLAESIRNNFVFWQVYDHKEEGKKVSTYYNVEARPVTMVIDPITGLQMRCWRGMVEAQTLMEDLMSFIDTSPKHTPPSTYKAVISQIHKRH